MNVKSLAGTNKQYVVAQVRQYDYPMVHFQIKSKDNSHANRSYGFAFNFESANLWNALDKLNGPKTTSLATDASYHFCQMRPKGGMLHVQILDGSVNREYGGAWDLLLKSNKLYSFLEEELATTSPEEQYVAEVSTVLATS